MLLSWSKAPGPTWVPTERCSLSEERSAPLLLAVRVPRSAPHRQPWRHRGSFPHGHDQSPEGQGASQEGGHSGRHVFQDEFEQNQVGQAQPLMGKVTPKITGWTSWPARFSVTDQSMAKERARPSSDSGIDPVFVLTLAVLRLL